MNICFYVLQAFMLASLANVMLDLFGYNMEDANVC